MTITFADVSHYQDVNLAAYKAAGYDRICMKISGGANDGTLRFADSVDMPGRWRQAGELGLHRIGYHFARNNNSGADEFDWCWSLIEAAGGMNPGDVLCYDQEDNRSQAMYNAAKARTLEFVHRAVARGITTGWIYSGKWYLEPAGIIASMLPAGWRQLWLSDYTAGQPDSEIEVPAGWARAQIVARQYTDAATIAGVSSTDADRVLHEWINPEEPDMTTVDLTAAAVEAIRSAIIGADVDPDPDHVVKLYAAVSSANGSAAQAADRAATAVSKISELASVVHALAVELDTVAGQVAKVDADQAALSAKLDALALGAGTPGAVADALSALLARVRFEVDALPTPTTAP